MISENLQITCGRVMLGWTQINAADATGLPQSTISNIERDPSRSVKKHVDQYLDVLKANGIVFTEYGVEKRDRVMATFQGEGWLPRLLKDVLITLQNTAEFPKELLIDNAEDQVSPPPVNNMYRKIRAAGIAMRQFTFEGNSYLMGPVDEYRYIPKDYFQNWITLIYGDKVAIEAFKEDRDERNAGCLVIKDAHLANTYRNKFNWLWEVSEKPTRSTADEKF